MSVLETDGLNAGAPYIGCFVFQWLRNPLRVVSNAFAYVRYFWDDTLTGEFETDRFL